MTINVGLFTDYAALPRAATDAKYPHCSPRLEALNDYVNGRWATTYNGCWGRRLNRAGTAVSVHSWAAQDTSFRSSAPSATERRRVMLEVIEFLRLHSLELGIQAIHDYIGCRIWHSDRDPKMYPDGWKIQKPDVYGMGKTWADWIHVEVHDVGGNWFDVRSCEEALGGGVYVPPVVRPVIGWKSPDRPLVKVVQQFLIDHAGQVIGAVDGDWGPRTQLGWNNFELWVEMSHPGSMTLTGTVDGIDWNVIAWNSGGWGELLAAGFPPGI